jgi:hypothetical protein
MWYIIIGERAWKRLFKKSLKKEGAWKRLFKKSLKKEGALKRLFKKSLKKEGAWKNKLWFLDVWTPKVKSTTS